MVFKGQLISKGLFGVFHSSKEGTKKQKNLKPSQNKKDQKIVYVAAPKMVSFSQLSAVKKVLLKLSDL